MSFEVYARGSWFTVPGEFQGELISRENLFWFQNLRDREVFFLQWTTGSARNTRVMYRYMFVESYSWRTMRLTPFLLAGGRTVKLFPTDHCLSMSAVFTGLHIRYRSLYQKLLVTEYRDFWTCFIFCTDSYVCIQIVTAFTMDRLMPRFSKYFE
jgi:hypothetical protein